MYADFGLCVVVGTYSRMSACIFVNVHLHIREFLSVYSRILVPDYRGIRFLECGTDIKSSITSNR